MRALGAVCEKNAILYTLLDDAGGEPEESELAVPASHDLRGDQLNWLLDETQDLLRRCAADVMFVKKGGTGRFGASAERHEVEAVIQIAAHRRGVRCELMTTDQLRAATGVPKEAGAYAELLKRPDVADRSNKVRRELFLYATIALASLRG